MEGAYSFLLFKLYLILFKKFLYEPVKKVMQKRQDEIDAKYMTADVAEMRANAHKKQWEEKMENAENEAAEIIKSATNDAKRRGDTIIADAQYKADRIIKSAETEAELEKKKVESDIKKELAGVSAVLAEKLLEREIQAEDHRSMIDAFIKGIGDNDEEHE